MSDTTDNKLLIQITDETKNNYALCISAPGHHGLLMGNRDDDGHIWLNIDEAKKLVHCLKQFVDYNSETSRSI